MTTVLTKKNRGKLVTKDELTQLVHDRLFPPGEKIKAVVIKGGNDRIDELPEPTKRASMLGRVEIVYLTVALDKLSSELHPNFLKALKAKRRDPNVPTATERVWSRLRAVSAPAYDAVKSHKCNVKVACAQAAKLLKDDARCYVQFWKELMKAVAFTAHIEASLLERHVDADVLSSGVDAMFEEHPIDDDVPIFDMSEADRILLREAYAGGEDRKLAAQTVEEVYSAIKYVQAWIGLAFSTFEPQKADFWGVQGDFPLDQETIIYDDRDTEYRPLRDFDSYRSWRKRQWSMQQRAARMTAETEDLLVNA